MNTELNHERGTKGTIMSKEERRNELNDLHGYQLNAKTKPNIMNYGKIPTWDECSDKVELDEIMPEGRGLLDPVERLIYESEPRGLDQERAFRKQVQEVVNFLSDNK